MLNFRQIPAVPAFDVPWRTAPEADGGDYLYYVGQVIKTEANEFLPFAPSDKPGLYSYNGKLNNLYFLPNVVTLGTNPYPSFDTIVAAGIFQLPTGDPGILPPNGIEVLFPRQDVPPALSGDSSPFGFTSNTGGESSFRTSTRSYLFIDDSGRGRWFQGLPDRLGF